MKKRLIILISALVALIALLLVLQLSHPGERSGQTTLLTVAEGVSTQGGIANLYLTIKPGSGNIYIDSFPLTRLDTQGSTRYANQIACDFLQYDCRKYDFYYTIRANSAIVGGPSAGGAMAVLTAAVLDNQPIRQDVAMTGTINSGGVIGPVAGIESKSKAASTSGIKLVLVPALSDLSNLTGHANMTLDGTKVVGIRNMEEALEIFTGKDYSRDPQPLKVPEEYDLLMAQIASDICTRSEELKSIVAQEGLPYNDTGNYTSRLAALSDGRSYSRASLCFSQNIELNTLVIGEFSEDKREEIADELRDEVYRLRQSVTGRQIETINDLETYEIVMERILEADEVLSNLNVSNSRELAYAQERHVSAQSWSRFFEMPGEPLELDEQHLKRACLSKLAEADERVNYLQLYSPALAENAQATLESAYKYETHEPILCIFSASKAKAQANLVTSALAMQEENVDLLVDEKLRAGLEVLEKQQEEGFFPILGYSYHQYAVDLRSDAPFSALTFAEYALELSNLNLYFPVENGVNVPSRFTETMLFFLYGTLFGVALTVLLLAKKLFR